MKTTLKENNEYLKDIQVTKVKFQKVPDNLKSNGGRMEAESVSKNSYHAWQGPKPAKAGPPTGNLRRAQSADFNFSRTSQDYSSGISTVKPAKVFSVFFISSIDRVSKLISGSCWNSSKTRWTS